MKHPKWLGSSVNPDKISLTAKGLVPFLVFLVAMLKLDIEHQALEELVVSIGALVSAATVVYGLGRKIWLKLKK